MDHFSNAREAKEFLVSRIVQEAQQEGVSLSEVERKMLYFTETAWTLPDIMEVSDEFDRTYDQGEYEQRLQVLSGTPENGLRRRIAKSMAAGGMPFGCSAKRTITYS